MVVVVVAVVVVGGISVCTLPFWSAIQMGNMEVEEVIERHVATLLMQDQAWISASTQFDRFFLFLPFFPVHTIVFRAMLQMKRRSIDVRMFGNLDMPNPFVDGMVEWLRVTPTATRFLGVNSEVLPRVSVSTSKQCQHYSRP